MIMYMLKQVGTTVELLEAKSTKESDKSFSFNSADFPPMIPVARVGQMLGNSGGYRMYGTDLKELGDTWDKELSRIISDLQEEINLAGKLRYYEMPVEKPAKKIKVSKLRKK